MSGSLQIFFLGEFGVSDIRSLSRNDMDLEFMAILSGEERGLETCTYM